MRKITFPYLVFSSLYFVLALFTILMLSLASFVPDFKQMFRLTTQPFGVYFNIGIVLLSCGLIVGIFNMVRIYMSHLPKSYSLMIALAICLFVFMFYADIFLFKRVYLEYFSLKDSILLSSKEAFKKTFYQAVVDYAFYFLFVMLPFLVYFLNFTFDKSTSLGRILHLIQPSFSGAVCMLFGFTVMPFFKSGFVGYIDFILLIFGFLMLGYFCIKGHKSLNSYEYFNLFLLLVIFAVMMSGSYEFVSGEAYFEIRKSFYILVLFGWCNTWMMKLTTKKK